MNSGGCVAGIFRSNVKMHEKLINQISSLSRDLSTDAIPFRFGYSAAEQDQQKQLHSMEDACGCGSGSGEVGDELGEHSVYGRGAYRR